MIEGSLSHRMKKHFYPTLAAILAFTLCGQFAFAKKLRPGRGEWLDMQSSGIVFGTIAETVRKESGSDATVTYYLRRKDGTGKPEKLVSEKGLFAFNLRPGWYEIYDWSISGTKGHESPDRYEFEIRSGLLTYIGRIITNVKVVENESRKKVPKNLPYVVDESSFDAGLFAEVYPVLAKAQAIVAVRNGFRWR